MKNFLWGTTSYDDKPVHVVLFVSRNKDNRDIKDFKERRKSFITTKTVEELRPEFKAFAEGGLKGEMSRMYYSVNARDPQKIYTQLMHFLFDNPDFNLCSIQSKIAGIAAQKECALEHKWMFDFDINDEIQKHNFTIRVSQLSDSCPMVYKTPNGYAIVINHGFDTRELMEEWGDNVTLKRDDLLCVDWDYK